MNPPLAVVDAMIVVSGVTGDPNGPSAAILDALSTGEVGLAISDADYIISYDGAVRDAVDALGFECVPPEELPHELRKDA